jgi:hypothetical protein
MLDRTLLLATTAAAALMALASPANAVLQLSAEFNSVPFSCVDQAGCDTNPAVGQLQITNQTIGGVTVNGSLQTQTIGGVNVLNTSSLQIINGNGTTVPLQITISGTSFTGPNNFFNASGSGTFQTAVGSTIALSFFDDPSNTQGADFVGDTPGTEVASFSKTATLIADSFSQSFTGAVLDPALFSMTLDAVGTLTAGGELISRGQTLLKGEVAVPEPGSLALLGGALISFVGFIGWRRRQS